MVGDGWNREIKSSMWGGVSAVCKLKSRTSGCGDEQRGNRRVGHKEEEHRRWREIGAVIHSSALLQITRERTPFHATHLMAKGLKQ